MTINDFIASRSPVAELSDAQINKMAYAIENFSPMYLEHSEMLHFWKIIPELTARLRALPAMVVRAPDFSGFANIQTWGNA